MHVFLKIAILLCFFEYASPSVNIPEIFRKRPAKTIEIPSPKLLDIREVTSDVYNCVDKANGNYANFEDCKSFYACVKNQTYFVACPEFPGYQTYYNPVRRICDKSSELACLDAIELEETENKETGEAKGSKTEGDSTDTKNKEDKESGEDEDNEVGKEDNDNDPNSQEDEEKKSGDGDEDEDDSDDYFRGEL